MDDLKELLMEHNKHTRGFPKLSLPEPLRANLLSQQQRVMLSHTIETSTRALHRGEIDVAIESFASGVCELARSREGS